MDRDGEHLEESLRNAGSTLEIRLRLARLGWLSDTRLSTAGMGGHGFSYQIWFKRHDWHGYSAEVTLRAGCHVMDSRIPHLDLDQADARDRLAMHAAVLKAGLLCLQAWDSYPASVPCQMPGSLLAENTYLTRLVFGAGKAAHPRGSPTERFPLDFGRCWAAPRGSGGTDEMLQLALEIGRLGATYGDDLNPYRWNPGSWHLDRKWNFEWSVAFPKWNGTATDHRGIRHATTDLSRAGVAALLESTLRTYSMFQDIYYPGSPDGDLPPGLSPSWLPLAKAERAIRAAEIAACPLVLQRDPSAMADMAAVWEERRLAHPVLSREWCELTAEHVASALEEMELSGSEPPACSAAAPA